LGVIDVVFGDSSLYLMYDLIVWSILLMFGVLMYRTRNMLKNHVPTVQYMTYMPVVLLISVVFWEMPKYVPLLRSFLLDSEYFPLVIFRPLIRFMPFKTSPKYLIIHLSQSVFLSLGLVFDRHFRSSRFITFFHWLFTATILLTMVNNLFIAAGWIATIFNCLFLSGMSISYWCDQRGIYALVLGTPTYGQVIYTLVSIVPSIILFGL